MTIRGRAQVANAHNLTLQRTKPLLCELQASYETSSITMPREAELESIDRSAGEHTHAQPCHTSQQPPIQQRTNTSRHSTYIPARPKAQREIFFMSEHDLERAAELRARAAGLPGWSDIVRPNPRVARTTQGNPGSDFPAEAAARQPLRPSSQHTLEEQDIPGPGASTSPGPPDTAQDTTRYCGLPPPNNTTDTSPQAPLRIHPLMFTSNDRAYGGIYMPEQCKGVPEYEALKTSNERRQWRRERAKAELARVVAVEIAALWKG
ncbi:hypothetical protein LTR86_010725 [Recurvomyces mirabilis]|nr:hypothetical protein LTR86_010725 [Recurvomyces mirabilis]